MKYIFFGLLFILFTLKTQAQLSGELINDGRKCLTETDFSVKASQEGFVKFTLTVNNEGNVIAEQIHRKNSTVTSTPSIIKARKFAKNLKFEKGTHYPKNHTVVVLLRCIKQ
jgi:hypothetical protein